MNHKPIFRFEKLDVWQMARLLNRSVYHATCSFPRSEQFGLTSQVRRASVSISSNIAEGSGRNSDADFAHFLEIAYGSLMEVVSQFYLALDEDYLDQDTFDSIADQSQTLAAKIASLSKSLGRIARIKAHEKPRDESPASRAMDNTSVFRHSTSRHSTIDGATSTNR